MSVETACILFHQSASYCVRAHTIDIELWKKKNLFRKSISTSAFAPNHSFCAVLKLFYYDGRVALLFPRWCAKDKKQLNNRALLASLLSKKYCIMINDLFR